MIISASRRTDIPSYYSEWFINRLKAGYALVKNPMNAAQISRINLTPEKVDCIVFWTKDPVPMLNQLKVLDQLGYNYYFQFSLNPYGNQIERNLRDKEDIVKTFRQLSGGIGKDRVIWRYDPIILNEELTGGYHEQQFERLCSKLQGYTDTCIISFVDLYSKLDKTVKKQTIREISEQEMQELAGYFSTAGRKYGIELRACCEKLDLSHVGVKASSCIDGEFIEKICGHPIMAKPDKNQRLGCGCCQSVDIGVYNTCLHGCSYCYANHSEASIRRNFQLHKPDTELLIGKVAENAKITERM